MEDRLDHKCQFVFRIVLIIGFEKGRCAQTSFYKLLKVLWLDY